LAEKGSVQFFFSFFILLIDFYYLLYIFLLYFYFYYLLCHVLQQGLQDAGVPAVERSITCGKLPAQQMRGWNQYTQEAGQCMSEMRSACECECAA
jgi:hypothetical protein